MKGWIHSIVFIFSFFCSFAQEREWVQIAEHEVSDVDAWDVDPMGKVIYGKSQRLYKLDTSFAMQFTEGIKRFGSVTKIDARHALKTLIFSESQQAIAFIDNTLTFHKGIKDLSILDIFFATQVSYSAQSNRYWVFDVDNTRLVLVDVNRNSVQVTENIAGLLNTLQVDELMEIENVLLLFDKSKGIYMFDIYGSMIDMVETQNAKAVHFSDNKLYYINDSELVRIKIKNREELRIPLPEDDIIKFRVLGSYIFFQTPTHLKKYLLKKK